MQLTSVYLVKDSGNHDIMFVTPNKSEAEKVHDWFEANTKPIYRSHSNSLYNVREHQVYVSPFEQPYVNFRVSVTTFGDSLEKLNYSIEPSPKDPTTVRCFIETRHGKETRVYYMIVRATDIEDAKKIANAQLEPYGVTIP